jgi:hypothetical protein
MINKLNDIKGGLIALNEDGNEKEMHRYIDAEDIVELVELVEIYRKALIFYATESTYLFDKWGSPIERDCGEMARKTLGTGSNC